MNWRVYDDSACAELEYRGIDLELCAEEGLTFFFFSFFFSFSFLVVHRNINTMQGTDPFFNNLFFTFEPSPIIKPPQPKQKKTRSQKKTRPEKLAKKLERRHPA